MTITVYRTLLNTCVGIGEFQLKDIVIGFLLNIRYSHLWFLTCMFVATISFWIIEWFGENEQVLIFSILAGRLVSVSTASVGSLLEAIILTCLTVIILYPVNAVMIHLCRG